LWGRAGAGRWRAPALTRSPLERVGWGGLVEPGWIGSGVVVPARWSGRAGDPGRSSDTEASVGLEGEGPATGEGLDAVVAAARAAQVGAGGGAAVGVCGDVVEVAAPGWSAAAGHAAGPVAGGDQAALCSGGPVGPGGWWWAQPGHVGQCRWSCRAEIGTCTPAQPAVGIARGPAPAGQLGDHRGLPGVLAGQPGVRGPALGRQVPVGPPRRDDLGRQHLHRHARHPPGRCGPDRRTRTPGPGYDSSRRSAAVHRRGIRSAAISPAAPTAVLTANATW
jgi:hypothetical protein